MKKKICIVTGTRAEYGLLRPIIKKLKLDKTIDLKVVVTGMHLSQEFGLTYKEIEKDNIKIDKKIEILLSSDTAVANCKSMGIALMSFGEYFAEEKPDLLIVLGDRYEIMAVAIAATINNIKIAHLHGGELTEGAFDDAFRHSITKMSLLHFASTEEYKNRIIQLGENPKNVFYSGAMGVENILELDLVSLEEIEKKLKFKLDVPFALVTFHPVTLEENSSETQVKELVKALAKFKDYKFIITKANSDKDGFIINKLLEEFALQNPDRIKIVTSMGVLNYLSAMKYAKAVIGNSSSGIIEAPSFNIPTINIGDRQKGRVQAKTVINCNVNEEDITKAIEKAFSSEFAERCKGMDNPYMKKGTSDYIIKTISDFLKCDINNMKKEFYDINRSEF